MQAVAATGFVEVALSALAAFLPLRTPEPPKSMLPYVRKRVLFDIALNQFRDPRNIRTDINVTASDVPLSSSISTSVNSKESRISSR